MEGEKKEEEECEGNIFRARAGKKEKRILFTSLSFRHRRIRYRIACIMSISSYLPVKMSTDDCGGELDRVCVVGLVYVGTYSFANHQCFYCRKRSSPMKYTLRMMLN